MSSDDDASAAVSDIIELLPSAAFATPVAAVMERAVVCIDQDLDW